MAKSRTKALTVAATISCALITAAHAAMTISSAKTRNVTCADGVCISTGGNANLNIGELQTMLASSDVTVKSSSSTPTLGVLDPLTWTNRHRLTLDAYETIHVKAPIVVEGTGAVTLITNDGGTGGDYEFDTPGSLTFWDMASNLVINGKSFTLVNTVEKLAKDIARTNPSGSYALANDYDASVDGIYRNPPVETIFTGTFDGLGHEVRNLVASPNIYGAFTFGFFVDVGGLVRDFGLVNAQVSLPPNDDLAFDQIGLLAMQSTGTISHSFATGTITRATGGSGGLVGINAGVITACHSDVKIMAFRAGGFVGGLVGTNLGTVSQSFAEGQVAGQHAGYAGGLAGFNSGTVQNSYSTASVAISNSHGIRYPYAGGLIASNYGGTVSQSYASGLVTGDDKVRPGGLIGNDSQLPSNIANAYWDLDTSGIGNPHQGAATPPDDPGIIGLTDAQLKSTLPSGFDPTVWAQNVNINNGWPYLLANPPQ